MNEQAKKVIEYFGGYQALANRISDEYESITRQAIEQWDVIPVRRVAQIVELSAGRFTRENLMPDIFK